MIRFIVSWKEFMLGLYTAPGDAERRGNVAPGSAGGSKLKAAILYGPGAAQDKVRLQLPQFQGKGFPQTTALRAI